MDLDKLVFIDETGVEDNICALYGYAEIGKRSYSKKDAFTKQRLSTIAGYRAGTKDLIAPFEYCGTANKDLFLGWFEQILCPNLEVGDYVVLDNASIHKGSEVYEIAEMFGINIIYLPPYSPDLNPIEKVWAHFKNVLRRIRHQYDDLREAIKAAWNWNISHSA
jgi:isftu1 transposase